jgi:hypothetical protein
MKNHLFLSRGSGGARETEETHCKFNPDLCAVDGTEVSVGDSTHKGLVVHPGRGLNAAVELRHVVVQLQNANSFYF